MIMNENKTQNQNTEKQNTEWVLIALSKKHILKRTDKYVLFDVDGSASGIISTKFLRKKEHEDMIFLSVPANYEINCQVREQVDGKWQAVKTYSIKAVELKSLVSAYNKANKPLTDLSF